MPQVPHTACMWQRCSVSLTFQWLDSSMYVLLQAPIPQDNVSYTSPAVGGHKEPLATTNGVATNGAGTTGLLHQGGYGVTNGVNGGTTTGMLHPGGSNGNVEMARI